MRPMHQSDLTDHHPTLYLLCSTGRLHARTACVPIVPNPPYFPAHRTYPTVAPQPSAASREDSLALPVALI